ncbi:hypothetical protein SGQ83_21675 [Flavobacterium sp. Fl-318]|uniref:Uncharacterized protein n=1 Tax=Flavobacterium cupriresistens TaxID=2893885 RepID=A0ABU4RHA7_9FLAO|nr:MULTISPECIES: hypothetical protein [unclassified Flavobacterium]MDX6191969.1 hypothetical protein [Flavobacterium sp. Fl-318]UFH44608.1 hypothetical protein LNP23_10475 [Flavobacterium sp. F-323]
MKTLTQHIKESLNNKDIKDVPKEKPLDEDLSDLMKLTSSKDSGIMRMTFRDEEEDEK